jgi:RsiW-degrading membrane proteinase PrsW (M82 family)
MPVEEWELLLGVLVLTRSLATPGAAPPVGALAARAPSLWQRWRFLLFGVALVPLAISIGSDEVELRQRLEDTVEKYPEIAVTISDDSITDDQLFAAIPDHKLVGAHLEYGSNMHWAYGAAAAVYMLTAVLLLFERRRARVHHLALTALFTGTAGILLLLGLQLLAESAQRTWMSGGGVVTLLFYIVKFIGFSYRAALDPDNGFAESLFGFTFGVGLCEEIVKALPLVWRIRRKGEVAWQDTCALGLASGIGFGVAEGVQYAADYYNGFTGILIYFVRFLSCVALHAVWAAAAGVVVFDLRARLRASHRWYAWIPLMVRIVAVPMVLHGLYDTLLKRELDPLALVAAVVSFGWLAFAIVRARSRATWSLGPASVGTAE